MWIYIRQDVQIVLPNLCFTANTANSTVQLTKNGSPTSVTLETTTDWLNWTTYTIGDTITLSNVWDKVYRRNTSETDTGFSLSSADYYKFVTTWSLACSWDVNYLLNKTSTTTVSDYCFIGLFQESDITTPPAIPATTLGQYCYQQMFASCASLEALPSFPALSYPKRACYSMFNGCSKIKISTTQTWEYQNEFRVPATWTGSQQSDSFTYMFRNTGWTYTSGINIDSIYYTSNTVI